MKLAIKPTSLELAYLQAAEFRAKYNLRIALDRHGVVRPEMIAHDYLHAISELTPSEQDENLIVKLDMHLAGLKDYPEMAELADRVRVRFALVKEEEAYKVFVRLYELGI